MGKLKEKTCGTHHCLFHHHHVLRRWFFFLLVLLSLLERKKDNKKILELKSKLRFFSVFLKRSSAFQNRQQTALPSRPPAYCSLGWTLVTVLLSIPQRPCVSCDAILSTQSVPYLILPLKMGSTPSPRYLSLEAAFLCCGVSFGQLLEERNWVCPVQQSMPRTQQTA